MSQVIATVEQAARWAVGGPARATDWNPVYRALVEGPALRTQSPPDEKSRDLVLRQLTAPALLVMAVTTGDTTHRLRIGLDSRAASLESAPGTAPSQWSEIAVAEVPSVISALLEDCGAPGGSPQMTIRREADGLRLTPEQNRTVRTALERGLSPARAYASIPDLDGRLHDALTAAGPRIALSLTLHDPHRRVTEQPVTWSRLWVASRRGLYRLDAPSRPDSAIHAVDGGDVLGTVLPVLEEALRFAAARSAAGEAR